MSLHFGVQVISRDYDFYLQATCQVLVYCIDALATSCLITLTFREPRPRISVSSCLFGTLSWANVIGSSAPGTLTFRVSPMSQWMSDDLTAVTVLLTWPDEYPVLHTARRVPLPEHLGHLVVDRWDDSYERAQFFGSILRAYCAWELILPPKWGEGFRFTSVALPDDQGPIYHRLILFR